MPSINRPLGYQQITALNAAVGLTVPHGATWAIISCETQAVRYRDDGVNPTAAVGQPLPVNTDLPYTGDLGLVKFIEQVASAKLNVTYYG